MKKSFGSPIDEAKYYRDQMNRNYLTPGEISEKVGKDRIQVEGTIRLLKLPVEVQGYLHQGILQREHGVVLSQVEDVAHCIAWGRRCISEHLSAKTLEILIKNRLN